MTNHLTDAQRRVVDKLVIDLHTGLTALGPARDAETLLGAMLAYPFPVHSLRVIARMLDRRADEMERRERDRCRKCGGEMVSGQALAQTYTAGSPDFPGDTHAVTFSAGGPGEMVPCRKCSSCGWSMTV